MKNPPIPLLCKRVEDVPAGEAIPPGVGKVKCGWCQEPVYAGKTSRDMVQTGTTQYLCFQCSAAFGMSPDLDGAAQLTPEGYQELLHLLHHERNRSK